MYGRILLSSGVKEVEATDGVSTLVEVIDAIMLNAKYELRLK